jgi:hypothetical protein
MLTRSLLPHCSSCDGLRRDWDSWVTWRSAVCDHPCFPLLRRLPRSPPCSSSSAFKARRASRLRRCCARRRARGAARARSLRRMRGDRRERGARCCASDAAGRAWRAQAIRPCDTGCAGPGALGGARSRAGGQTRGAGSAHWRCVSNAAPGRSARAPLRVATALLSRVTPIARRAPAARAAARPPQRWRLFLAGARIAPPLRTPLTHPRPLPPRAQPR